MHAAELSSPAVAHRGLQRLVDLSLAEKDAYGRYSIKEKIGFRGYVWLGKSLVPRFIIYGVFFVGLLVPEAAVLGIRCVLAEPIDAYALLVAITAFSSAAFLFEGLRLRKKLKN